MLSLVKLVGLQKVRFCKVFGLASGGLKCHVLGCAKYWVLWGLNDKF